MKKRFLNILSIILFAITFLSCENAIQQSSGNNNANERKKTAYVCVKNAGFSEASRTAFPSCNSRDLTDLVLSGVVVGGNPVQLASADSLDELSSKLIEIEEGKWIFSLTAKLNGVNFHGDTAVTAANGQTMSLAFLLEPNQSSNKGGFSITVAFEGEAERATGVIYDLYEGDKYYFYINSGSVAFVQNERKETELEIRQNENGQKYVNFAFPFESGMFTGKNFRAEIAFYNNGTPLNTYYTSVIIEDNYVSKETAFISLSNSYTITFHNLEDGEFLTAVKGAYTRKDTGTIVLPAEIKRVGYKFRGWYDNEDLSGNPVTEFTITTYEKKDFWAKWEVLDPFSFYIKQGGNGDGSSADNALGSMQDAIDKIINICDSNDPTYNPDALNTRYYIKVVGMLSGLQTLSGSFNVGSLTIEGANGIGSNGEPQDSIPSGCAITIEETPVTLKNISISNTNDVALCVGSQQNNTETEVILDSGTLICNTMNSNSTIDGGGINIAPQATVTMKAGSKIKNTHAANGAGVCVSGNATFKMKGGEITENGGQYGAGVYVCEDGIFEMSGGKISDNIANNDGGGIWSYGTSTLSGGEISGNTAKNGAGIYKRGYYFSMSGGEVSSNTSSASGGGIYNYDSGTFSLTGGEISDNTAAIGSGVYNNGQFELREDAQIDSSNDVYFTTNRELIIAGPLNKSSVATITPLEYKEDDDDKMLELKVVGFDSLSGHTYYITTTSIAAEASKFSITTQTIDEDGDPLKQSRNWQVKSDGTIHTDDPLLSDYTRLLLGSELNSNINTTKASLEAGKQYKFVLDEYYASSLTNLMSLLKPTNSYPAIFGESIVNLSKNETISYTASGYYSKSNYSSFANNLTKIVLPKNVYVNRDPQANMFRDVQAYLKEIVITPGNDPSVLTLSDGALLLEINGGGYGVEMSLYCYPSQREGTTYTIPDDITYLYDSAFYKNTNLTTINGLDRITKLGGSVFEETQKLREIDIRNVTDFGDLGFSSGSTPSPRLFRGSKVEKVTLPANVFTIGEGWFDNCSELKEIVFLGSTPPNLDQAGTYNTSTIWHFDTVNSSVTFTVPEGAIPAYLSDTSAHDGVYGFAVTQNYLFYHGGFYITDGTNIAVGVNRVGEAVEKITEAGKTIIIGGQFYSGTGEWATASSALAQASVPISLDCSYITSGAYGAMTTAFANNEKLAGISLPSSINAISEGAFASCTNLVTVEMTSNVTTIGAGAFSGCTNLTTVIIGGTEVTTDVEGWKDDTNTQIVLADGQTFAQYLQTCTSELKKN